MLKFLKYCFFAFLGFSVLATAVLAGTLYYLVSAANVPEIDEAHINEILSRESPVYYRDGKEKLGVLFEGVHRQYVSYDKIPTNFVNALTAAEDGQFFSHHGIDIPGILRAAVANFKAGRIVQGGSTLTQQTAKNLFKRESRSFKAKFKELLFALRLEHRYSKQKILEFYSNQFFVSGNGHGLGVAARYFFDKQPQDLNLLECAFIAGSVKRPNYYNPFLRKNAQNPERTRQRLEERVRYVLGKMLKERMISQKEFDGTKVSELTFTKGKMSFTQSTAMDLVREGLEAPFIVDMLEENGISNISTSGAKVITTLDGPLQNKSLAALRRQLSQLDVRLRGYHRPLVQVEYKALKYRGDSEIKEGAFVFGVVSGLGKGGEDGLIQVELKDGAIQGRVDEEGVKRLVESYTKHRKNPWATAGDADRRALLAQIQTGDRIYVSVRSIEDDGTLSLELERFPQVEGAALVRQEGVIRAMAGGMSNRNFNRATTAKRIMGSTFKPFVFAAALQLGWSPVDLLRNDRGTTFSFMRQGYEPQPDHKSPFSRVSMSWAGVTSENVAAVWLLYHLTDHLDTAAIKELAEKLDMAPRTVGDRQEDYRQYKARIRDNYGILLNKGHVAQAAYHDAVEALRPDFLFDNKENELRHLLALGQGGFRQVLRQMDALANYRRSLQSGPIDPDNVFSAPAVQGAGSTGRLAQDADGHYVFTSREPLPEDWIEVNTREVSQHLAYLGYTGQEAFWQQVLLDGVASGESLRQVQQQLQKEQGKFSGAKAYSLEVLSQVRDFRIMLGLQYLLRLARACGVESEFKPVLSIPLGSNVVSLSEMTRIYETMVTGKRYEAVDSGTKAVAELDGGFDLDGAAIIDRIETPDGRVVYSREGYASQVFDQKTATALSNILQNTVTYGTGRYAHKQVRVHAEDAARDKLLTKLNLPYPLLGKTGTANDYRNASFLGYVPNLAKDGGSISLAGGYTVGVYVGYDNNNSMVKGATHVSGSLGALPAWSDIAQAILDTEKIGDRLDTADLAFSGLALRYPDLGQFFVPVNPQQGGQIKAGQPPMRQALAPSQAAILSYGQVLPGGQFQSERTVTPFWQSK